MATPIPPPLGQVKPGELYVDLATRTLWLGVDESVSEDRAVLISNIQAADDLAASVLVNSKAYTDALLKGNSGLPLATTGYSAIGHKHVAADVTNFDAAVDARITASPAAANFIRGMVLMYSGLLADIGTGPLAGWALCDGSLGTPNLRDKFILGAGNREPWPAPGAINPANPLVISGGAHVHTINPTVLSAAELPAHNHGGVTGNDSPNHAHPVSIVTDAQGQHQHTGLFVNASGSDSAEAGPLISVNAAGSGPIGIQSSPASYTVAAGIHTHTVAGNTGVPSTPHTHTIASVGGGQGHTHTEVGGTTHEHTVAQTALRDAMPYVLLAYIMKL